MFPVDRPFFNHPVIHWLLQNTYTCGMVAGQIDYCLDGLSLQWENPGELSFLWALVPDVDVVDHRRWEEDTCRRRRVFRTRIGFLFQNAWVSSIGDHMMGLPCRYYRMEVLQGHTARVGWHVAAQVLSGLLQMLRRAFKQGGQVTKKAPIHSFIHSRILILLSSARLWEVLGITVIKEDGGLGRSWWEKASLKTWLLYRQEHPF